MLIDLLYLTLIIVFITDISGVVSHIETALAKWLKVRKVSVPLLTCSLCQTWWVGLLYLLITHNVTLGGIALVGGFAYLTTVFRDLLYLVKDILETALDWMEKTISK